MAAAPHLQRLRNSSTTIRRSGESRWTGSAIVVGALLCIGYWLVSQRGSRGASSKGIVSSKEIVADTVDALPATQAPSPGTPADTRRGWDLHPIAEPSAATWDQAA